jgi:uncharacterized coiled-coil DUF342 family protein
MNVQTKLVHIPAAGRSLAARASFAAIWIRAAAIGKVKWKPAPRQWLKRILLRVPAFRQYLAEKYTLAASLTEAITERDQHQAVLREKQAELSAVVAERDTLLAGRDRLQAELDGKSASVKGLVAERDSLLAARNQLQGEVEGQRVTLASLIAERDSVVAAHNQLRGEVEGQRATLGRVIAERDSLVTAHNQLQMEVEGQRAIWGGLVAERDSLVAARNQLQTEVEGQRATLRDLVAERDSVIADRQDLKQQLDHQRTVSISLTSERDRLIQHCRELDASAVRQQSELEKAIAQIMTLSQERTEYQHLVLGRLATLQSEFGTLQRGLVRLSSVPSEFVAEEVSRKLYLDLLEASLIGSIINDESVAPWFKGYDPTRRELGRDWPKLSFTMIGKARLRNIRELTETVLSEGVLGDFLEAGVWRGGACIYMRGILKAHGIDDRTVWVADSFAGLPPPNPKQYPADRDDTHHAVEPLAVSMEDVRDNFSRYGLLDEQVRFLKGWFKDTLPNAPVKRLALLRLDGDMYESTIQTLEALYWKVSPRGFVVVDDYILPPCKQAVDDFRARHRIVAKLEVVDGAAVYWSKTADGTPIVGRAASKRKKQS